MANKKNAAPKAALTVEQRLDMLESDAVQVIAESTQRLSTVERELGIRGEKPESAVGRAVFHVNTALTAPIRVEDVAAAASAVGCYHLVRAISARYGRHIPAPLWAQGLVAVGGVATARGMRAMLNWLISRRED